MTDHVTTRLAALEGLSLADLLGRSFIETADASLDPLTALCALTEAFAALDRAGFPTLYRASELDDGLADGGGPQ